MPIANASSVIFKLLRRLVVPYYPLEIFFGFVGGFLFGATPNDTSCIDNFSRPVVFSSVDGCSYLVDEPLTIYYCLI